MREWIKTPRGKVWHWVQQRRPKVKGKTEFDAFCCNRKFYLLKWKVSAIGYSPFPKHHGIPDSEFVKKQDMCRRAYQKWFVPGKKRIGMDGP